MEWSSAAAASGSDEGAMVMMMLLLVGVLLRSAELLIGYEHVALGKISRRAAARMAKGATMKCRAVRSSPSKMAGEIDHLALLHTGFANVVGV